MAYFFGLLSNDFNISLTAFVWEKSQHHQIIENREIVEVITFVSDFSF